MIYLLNTNACIVYLNRPVSGIRRRLQLLPPQDVAMCSVVKAELFFGAMRSDNPVRTLARQEALWCAASALAFKKHGALGIGHWALGIGNSVSFIHSGWCAARGPLLRCTFYDPYTARLSESKKNVHLSYFASGGSGYSRVSGSESSSVCLI